MSKAYGGPPSAARGLRPGAGGGAERLAHDDGCEPFTEPLELARVLLDHSWVHAAFLEDRTRVHEPFDPQQQLVDLVAWPLAVRPPDSDHVCHCVFLSSDVELME